MSRMIRLIPPKGTTGFSHGGEHFEAGDDGTVLAPTEAVDPLCRVGGFTLAPDDPPPSPPADDETPADDPESSLTEAIESADDNPPATETDYAPPVASSFHRLVIPAIPTAVSLGRVPAVG